MHVNLQIHVAEASVDCHQLEASVIFMCSMTLLPASSAVWVQCPMLRNSLLLCYYLQNHTT